MAKPGLGSEVVIMDEGVLAGQMAREMPHVTSLSVTKSSRVHVGPKIVHVNQTVQNKEMIKGECMTKVDCSEGFLCV